MNIEKRNITVQEAAKLMGKSEMYVRIRTSTWNFKIWNSYKT